MGIIKLFTKNLSEAFRRFSQSQEQKTFKQPVLIIPGFGLNNSSTIALRNAIEKQGFAAYGWNSGTNFGANSKDATKTSELIKDISAQHDQKLIIIGYSQGGLYARELSRKHAELIDHCITISSPIQMAQKIGRSEPLKKLLKIFDAENLNNENDVLQRSLESLPIPCTSFYSEIDKIVKAKYAKNKGENHETNIRADFSHLDFLTHPDFLETLTSHLNNIADHQNKSFDQDLSL